MSRTVRVLALNVLLAVLAMGALRLAFFAVFRNPADAPDAAGPRQLQDGLPSDQATFSTAAGAGTAIEVR